MEDQLRRRRFLQLGTAATLAAGLDRSALGQKKAEPLRVGVIGVGSRGTYHLGRAVAAGLEIPALCDIDEAHLNRGIGIVAKARNGRKPEGYSKGPTDYRRMLKRDDLDAVIVTTPMQDHGVMSIDALRAGKHVLSEVAAAMTLDECWGLVRAAEETGKIYMLAENCCYYQHLMMVLNMVQKGIFGELTYADCGYVHNCRPLNFKGDGTLTWRGEMARDYAGNLYPTHSLGPVAQWLGINRGDRMVSLQATSTKSVALSDYAKKRFPQGHPARKVEFKVGDSVTTLIRTAKGAMIDLRCDMYSARPCRSTTYHSLQGTTASYETLSKSIWIEGRSKGHQWESQDKYAKEFEHPMWTRWSERAKGSGHGGGDFFVLHEFLEAVRRGGPAPIDAYDAATWSSIIPLSAKSLAEGGRPQEIPDFTKGKWEARRA